MCVCVCLHVCVCVSAPQSIKNHSREILNNQSNKSYYFSMTLAIHITDGRGLGNEARRELLLNKNKVMQC